MNLNNSADISNIAIKLSRLARKIGVNTNDYPLLVSGNPAQCLEFSKRVVFFVVKEVAQDMINRRITEQSPDKRVVFALFDMLRESAKKSQNTISADQFLSDGFAEHKLLILIKLVEYVIPLAKNQAKVSSPSPSKQLRGLSSPGSSSSVRRSSGGSIASSELSLTDLRVGVSSPESELGLGMGVSPNGSSLSRSSSVGTVVGGNKAGDGRVSFENENEGAAMLPEEQPFIEGDHVFQKLMASSGNANYDTKRFDETNSAAMTAKCEALVQKQLVPFQKQMVKMVQVSHLQCEVCLTL